MFDEPITAVCLTADQNTLVAGTKSGRVGIFDINGDTRFQTREIVNAFYDEETKKKRQVSQVAVHKSNEALFASSDTGCLKLLRLKV